MSEAQLGLRAVHSPADIAQTAALASEIWNEYYPAIIGAQQTQYMVATLQSEATIARQVESGSLRYFVVELDGEALGYAAVEAKPTALFVSKLYLRASARGRGHGQRALALLGELARMEGLAELSLTVNRGNALAIKAYERFGMKIVGEQRVAIGEGYVMDDYVLSGVVGR